jgi:hypothetical protein
VGDTIIWPLFLCAEGQGMTEHDWLVSDRTRPLIGFLCAHHGVSHDWSGRRRLILFACACMRRLLDLAPVALVLRTVELAEREASIASSEEALEHALAFRYNALDGLNLPEEIPALLAGVVRGCVWPPLRGENLLHNVSMLADNIARALEEHRPGVCVTPGIPDPELWQAELLRDIFGNPYCPLRKRPFPAEVRGLAHACAAGDSLVRSILADALSDLNEDRAADHLRQPVHVTGCHVVDWVLASC